MTAGTEGLIVDNPAGLALPGDADAILNQMFTAYSRVTLVRELAGGFSGSRVFVTHPVRSDGLPELPAVVKLGPRALIEQEWQAYRKHVQNRLPGVAAVQGPPQEVTGTEWAGLRYPLVGSGTFAVKSLEAYYRQASGEALRYVLEERLFRQLGAVWRFNQPVPDFSLRASYDHLLPINLLIRPEAVPEGAPVQILDGTSLGAIQPVPGALFRLAGFAVTEVRADKGEITLNLLRPDLSYRIRLRSPASAGDFAVGDVVDGLTGRITSTRRQMLAASVLEGWGYGFAVDADTITLPGGRTLPNALTRLPDVLAATPTVRVAAIHGDLNPLNVLLDPETQEVRLIDFANARQDHVLHDLLRLETGVITRLLPYSLHKAGLPPEVIVGLYEQLAREPEAAASAVVPGLAKAATMLASIRRTAINYLFDPDDWGEYAHGLTLYLLGAHKYANLDATAKKVAFLGAAITQQLVAESALQEPSPTLNKPQEPSRAPPGDFLPRAELFIPPPPATSSVKGPAFPWWLPALLVMTAFLVVMAIVIGAGSDENQPEETVTAGLAPTNMATTAPSPSPTLRPPTAAATRTRSPAVGGVATRNCTPRGANRSIIVLLDISQSMHGEKLNQAIAALTQFITCLDPTATIAVYTFNNEVHLLEPTGAVSEVGEPLQQRLDTVFAWGESALYDAVCQATETAEAGGRYSLILLADGPDTASTTFTDEDAALECVPPEVRLLPIAYGSQADVQLLARLAEQSSGSVREASPETIGRVLLTITLP